MQNHSDSGTPHFTTPQSKMDISCQQVKWWLLNLVTLFQ